MAQINGLDSTYQFARLWIRPRVVSTTPKGHACRLGFTISQKGLYEVEQRSAGRTFRIVFDQKLHYLTVPKDFALEISRRLDEGEDFDFIVRPFVTENRRRFS